MNPIKNGWLNNVHKENNEEGFNSKGENQRTILICKEIWGIFKIMQYINARKIVLVTIMIDSF